MCKKYKILNLTTGRCYNKNLPDFQTDFPEVLYSNEALAQAALAWINRLNTHLANHRVKPYHLEVIEIEVQDS